MNSFPFSIGLATFFGWASLLVVYYQLSPFTQPKLALSLFYLSLFVALTGTFALILYSFRRMTHKDSPLKAPFNVPLRQGVLLSLMVVVGLIFQRLRVLTWWDALLLLAIILLIEFYFMSRD